MKARIVRTHEEGSDVGNVLDDYEKPVRPGYKRVPVTLIIHTHEDVPETKHRRSRAKNPYRHAERPKAPLMMTVPEAAETLRTTVDALRARLRRAQVVGADGSVTAPLGPGIVGMKVGANTWRVRFDPK